MIGFGPAVLNWGASKNLIGMPSPFNNKICAVLVSKSSVVHTEFQGSQLHRRAARLIPNKHEYTLFELLSVIRRAFCSVALHLHDTHFLQCSRRVL